MSLLNGVMLERCNAITVPRCNGVTLEWYHVVTMFCWNSALLKRCNGVTLDSVTVCQLWQHKTNEVILRAFGFRMMNKEM